MSYSDEPVLVRPPRRLSLKAILGILVVVVFAGGILSVPLYQNHLDNAALAVPRGPHQGALYHIVIGGVPHTLELGWIAPAFSAELSPAPAPGATLEVSGDFGHETLRWDAAKGCFGPGSAHLNPQEHHKVRLTLRQNDQTLWTARLWFYGVPPPQDDD